MINKISPTGQKEEEKEEKGGYLRKKRGGCTSPSVLFASLAGDGADD